MQRQLEGKRYAETARREDICRDSKKGRDMQRQLEEKRYAEKARREEICRDS